MSFKVICIDDIAKSQCFGRNVPAPLVGDIDIVIVASWDKDLGDYYSLERFGTDFGYSCIHFAILSEIDETEFERNYNKEIV